MQNSNENVEFDEELDVMQEGLNKDEVEKQENRRKNSGFFAWMISAMIHVLILGVLTLILIHEPSKPNDIIITTTEILEEEVEEEEIKEIEIIKEIVEVKDPMIVETPVVTTEEVSEEVMQTDSEMDAESAEGVSEAISDMPLVGSGLMGNIGGGGGGGGSFGQRAGGGRKKAVLRNGGSRKTESAVELGLNWLAAHQEPHGGWETAKYEGVGNEETDKASSGMALLAFLGAGYTDRAGKYKDTVSRAIDWLIKNQKPDGTFFHNNYVNGICTLALAEAYGMGCKGKALLDPTKKALEALIKQRNTTGGWNYNGPRSDDFDDMSVSGWCIMALKSGMMSGLKVQEAEEIFIKYGELLDSVKDKTGDNTSTTKGLAWYTKLKVREPWQAMAAVAMLVRQYIGWKRFEPWMMAVAKGQNERLPAKGMGMLNVYRVYYAYLALFQHGGDEWKKWNNEVTPVILGLQRQDGDFKGSWDPGAGVRQGGRVLTTAMLVTCLEVYYRYKTIMK